MPTLLQINVTCNVGSTGRIAEQIGEIAISRGWESYIAYGRECKGSKSKALKIGSPFSIIWHILMTRLFDKHGLCSHIATHRFIRDIRRIKPDIIHLHNIHGYYINYQLLFDFLSTSGIPIVWTLHDCWSFTGHCSYFILNGCKKWETLCNSCLQKHSYPTSLFWDSSRTNFSHKLESFCKVDCMTIVTPSQWLANIVKRSFLSKYPIEVINNGIDSSIFRPSISDIRENYHLDNFKIILGVSNQWTVRKGLNDFVSLSKLIDENIRIVLIGLAPNQIKSLPPQIIAITKTHNVAELAAWYSAADVFVNPTYEDNYPTVNLEARACGKRVITYNTGGSPESAGPNAIIVEQGNVDKLYKAIVSVIENPISVREAECAFDMRSRFEAYFSLYNRLMSGQ